MCGQGWSGHGSGPWQAAGVLRPDLPTSTCDTCSNREDPATLWGWSGWSGGGSRGYSDPLNFWTLVDKNFWRRPSIICRPSLTFKVLSSAAKLHRRASDRVNILEHARFASKSFSFISDLVTRTKHNPLTLQDFHFARATTALSDGRLINSEQQRHGRELSKSLWLEFQPYIQPWITCLEITTRTIRLRFCSFLFHTQRPVVQFMF